MHTKSVPILTIVLINVGRLPVTGIYFQGKELCTGLVIITWLALVSPKFHLVCLTCCHIHINNETIKQVDKFKYLGSTITSDGRNDAEIKIRIGMVKDAFQKMEKVIKYKNITIETRNRILQCYVIPILTYGSECWTISPNMERKLEATEMWFHRRMLHISWKDHVTNDDVLRRGRTERKLMNRIRAGQMSFLGHIMRKHGLENIVSHWKIEGERSRGRPRLNFMKSLSQLLKISEVEIIERTRNREEWRTMTANVRIGYGT